MSDRTIALVTPAHNEATHLPRLISSMVAQHHRPDIWVVVSDGSTDDTDRIAAAAAAGHDFIRFTRHDGQATRDFARKVAAIDHGASLIDDDCAFFGITDADVEFPPDYFAELLDEFEADAGLGLAGGLVVDVDEAGRESGRPGRPDVVPGAVQLYRSACWADVGGYPRLTFGSEDTIACLTAQMRGWRTRVIDRLEVRHHRVAGTADRSLIRARYREGRRDRATGYHPVFVLAKAVRRLPQRPIVAGSLARLAGFVAEAVRGGRPGVDDDVVAYLRDRQLRELRIRR